MEMNELIKKFLSFLPLMGIGISLLLLVHSLWQMDLIDVRPIWQTQEWIPWFLKTGLDNYSDMPFQCGFFFRTTIGNANDYYLGMCVVSWFLLLLSMYFYPRVKNVTIKTTTINKNILAFLFTAVSLLLYIKIRTG